MSLPTAILGWIDEVVKRAQPDAIKICDGSRQEYIELTSLLVKKGTFTPLNPKTRPFSFLARSDPDDVARIEESTFICTKNKEDAGPTNNWKDPDEMKRILEGLLDGCMQGRIMYVIAFCMGPIDSSLSRLGLQITDSPYVVCNMHLMTLIGPDVLQRFGSSPLDFVLCLHSVGMPLAVGQRDVSWPCNQTKYIAHFPEERKVISYGSGYGGNALMGKKCFALRIASTMGKSEGWLAEHMMILGVTSPAGEKKYIAAAFPSACGKTNLAMLQGSLPGWKFETVGDDIAWMKFDKEGVLRAINPEIGFFGVATGTSMASNPNAMQTLAKNVIFTNVALTDDKDVWWEGMTKATPDHLIDWQGRDWSPHSKEVAAHPNSRFTVMAKQCPVIDPSWQDPKGVPISAILFGGRRSTAIPLVKEAFDWDHGVFFGASMSSETTAAAVGKVGALRRDPFAMLPFCGYNMGDYFAHWIDMKRYGDPKKLPKFYSVNWFRKNANGKYLWPGFGDNCRVIKWIFERIQGNGEAIKSKVGFLPTLDALDMTGLNYPIESLKELLTIDSDAWQQEKKEIEEYFALFGNRLPSKLQEQLLRD